MKSNTASPLPSKRRPKPTQENQGTPKGEEKGQENDDDEEESAAAAAAAAIPGDGNGDVDEVAMMVEGHTHIGKTEVTAEPIAETASISAASDRDSPAIATRSLSPSPLASPSSSAAAVAANETHDAPRSTSNGNGPRGEDDAPKGDKDEKRKAQMEEVSVTVSTRMEPTDGT